ncbi:MAG: TIGR01777 family oxidoreductase [Saprospiraceae bacterium]|nr:TIGR01777 family oxidoreductase [Saprospiraceae bacterium]MDW8483627.1 TIGR01777 family oxidoreductase [Saprospiraceae bacterium]
MEKTVLIAGGSGFIGSRLVEMLEEKGYSTRILTRMPRAVNHYEWDPLAGRIDDKAVVGANVVINLAGAGIADKRWTPERKRLIVASRVESARVLREAFQRLSYQPEAYLAASAIGYYGNSGERWMTENDPPADQSFLSASTVEWERATETIGALGIRTAVFRIGIVLERSGGALREIARPLKFGLGAYFADGQAWYSWIHRDDVCRMFLWAMRYSSVEGIYNAVAPHPVRNRELVHATARAMKRWTVHVPVPAFALRLMLGEMATVVLHSTRVSAAKIQQTGFTFQYPHLEEALAHIFRS